MVSEIEVVSAVRSLLDDTAKREAFALAYTEFDWGSQRNLREGAMMPEDGVDRLRPYDAILPGAVGHHDIPDHVTLRGFMLPIRKELDQQICKRPTRLLEGVQSPLRGHVGGDIDFVVFRENTEGEYADVGGCEHRGFDREVAVQSAVFTREATETVVREVFEAATERDGKLTKSNVQAYGMVLWDDVVDAVGEQCPGVTVERLLVDAAAMDFVRRPDTFDVVVASNLFGEISLTSGLSSPAA